MFFRLLNALLFIFFLFFATHNVYAADIKTSYSAEYFLNDKISDLETKVRLTIKLKLLKSALLIKKFTLVFPGNFGIRNLTAMDDKGNINPIITPENLKIKIDLNLNDPNVGLGDENNLILEFYQDNLFKINGNVWEVILPVIENVDEADYQVIVNLPATTDKKISISKPKPDKIIDNKIIWQNIKNRTIYAVFGDKQYYKTKLSYNLKNSDLFPTYTYIALPPDTLYQKIFLNSLNPQPIEVLTDEDGNFMAKYLLKPKEIKTILYEATITTFSKPREDLIRENQNRFFLQQNYLLSVKKYWQITDINRIKALKTPEQIYNFVTTNLKYDYKKLSPANVRLGADKILKNPDSSLCIDFSDLFIAVSREVGIKSREIEGFGFSQDKMLRPVSLWGDILHSWPEYYDELKKVWIPVDPTWENTSGIDYYNSFDLNHIVFAIHGLESDYPLPAGMYKIADSKDIDIEVTNDPPQDKIDVEVKNTEITKKINDKDTYKAKFLIKNNSNVYLRNYIIILKSDSLIVNPKEMIIDSLPPFGKKEISINYKSNNFQYGKKITDFSLYSTQNQIFYTQVEISPYLLEEIRKFTGLFLVISFLIIFVIILRRKRKSK